MTNRFIGILCDGSVSDAYASAVAKNLSSEGCLEQNIRIKYVPSADEVPLGVLFFAEYTDVDAVIVLTQNALPDYIKKSVAELQIQWNMPVIFGTGADFRSVALRVESMIALQDEMERESDELANPDRRSIN